MRFVSVSFLLVPSRFGSIWFQRSFGYKFFLITSFFVSRLSLSCHPFVTFRNADALDQRIQASCGRLMSVTLILGFMCRTPCVKARDSHVAPMRLHAQ